ncbi:peroxiredoxin [Variovorax paradoxus]|uniref:Peroxiredoxin n=1 Tax=Variovorax paradoxus TaxID=34073 RepID=A0A0D0N1T4_VARPD|nr:Ohr family peroxiredoxin [Variovorax paradoxus]KIQ35325.1 peroxiredoxin [Variovorax paradoxus]
MPLLAAPSVALLAPYTGSEMLPLYTTTVAVSGGEARHARASGRAVSDDGNLDLVLRLPEALGGNGGGTNPEQLFAAGFAACFHGAMTLVAAARKIRLPHDIDIAATVTFGRDPADGLFLLRADLSVSLPAMDAEDAAALVAQAEKVCPYAKMARTGMQSTVRLV